MEITQRKYRKIALDSLKTSIIVGSVLLAINQGEKVIALNFSFLDLLHWSLNYLVPFFVSFYSRVEALKKSDEK